MGASLLAVAKSMYYFRQHEYRSNFRFPFSSLLTLKLSLLYKMQVVMRFPAKVTSNCIWVAIFVDWVILHWFACGADRRSGGRAYGHVITKFSWMARLLHFLTHGAPLSSLRVRELHYKSNDHNVNKTACVLSFVLYRIFILGFF